MSTLVINGVEYERIQRERAPKTKLSPLLAGLLAMGMQLSTRSATVELPPINLIEEFEKIQQKKSRLSVAQRRHVEYLFHRQYQVKLSEPASVQRGKA